MLDIETSPNLAHVWGLWNENVGITQLREASEVLCFSSKWLNDPAISFYSVWDQGHDEMVREAHRLLEEADAVVHYNGKSFDIPHLNREILLAGLGPPAPYAQIDLYTTVKKRFKFPSNKLDYVSQALGLGAKVHHEGHELWVKVMTGDREAQGRMRAYNEQDVLLTEKLYHRLLPWIPSHPNVALIDGIVACTTCGANPRHFVERETADTPTSKFARYQCLKCGSWQRETSRVEGSKMRSVSW